MQSFHSVARFVFIAVLSVCVAGCATVPRTPRVSEDLLVTAGFKTVAARTDAQQQHLQTLQQGAVSEMQQTGKHFYVYPDLANRRLYVGTPKEYESYLALRTRNGLPNPAATDAASADRQQYLKRDAAMAKADAQKVEEYSWTAWPDFAVLFSIR